MSKIAEYKKLLKDLQVAQIQIENAYKKRYNIENALNELLVDNFFYIVRVNTYGRIKRQSFNNLKSAIEFANAYHEDNGFADILTNNKNANIYQLNAGSYYFVNAIEEANKWTHPSLQEQEDVWGKYKEVLTGKKEEELSLIDTTIPIFVKAGSRFLEECYLEYLIRTEH
jgi:hypothetical protein